MKPDTSRGYVLALSSAIILSTTAVFIRHLTAHHHLDPLVLAVWRAGFAAVTLFAALGLRAPALLRVGRADLGFLAGYGLVLAGFNASWTIAVALTGASLSTVLVNGSAAFTALLGWWFLKEHLGLGKVAAVGLSLTGCAVISGVTGQAALPVSGVGIALGILSALFYATYSLLGRTAFRRGLNPWTTVAYTFAFACLALLVLTTATGRAGNLLALGTSIPGWTWLFLLAAGPTVIGFGLYNASMNHLPSSVANLIMTSEPVFTALLAYRLFDERMDAVQIVGSLLVLGGVAVLRTSDWVRDRWGAFWRSEERPSA